MTVHFSELEDKFWIRDGEGVLWFESSLDAKHALDEMKVRDTVNAEVAMIAAYFRKAGLTQIAASIEARDYKKGQENA